VAETNDPRKASITGYTAAMAKVMISLPDELLARLDAQAAERGSTRSATIRDLAEAALGERERLLAQRMADLDGHAAARGGDVVDELKAGRPA
jgi:predicted DNA-binding protein